MSDQNELVDFLVQNLEVGTQDKNKKVVANSGHQRQVRQPTGQKNANVNGTGSDQNGFPNSHKNMMGSNNVNNMSMYTNQSQQGAQIPSPYMYAQSNSDQGRDREWQEYVQLMNIPGIQPTSGYPMDQRAAYAQDDLVYGQSQDEANFVQNFVQSPQFLPYLPGYFQHPAFTNQLYSDGRNLFPGQIYGFQQQYIPPGQMITPDSFQNNLANNYAYSKLVQNVPIDPNELNAELTETDLDQNGQAFYTINHAMGSMSIQEEKPRSNTSKQSTASQPQSTSQPSTSTAPSQQPAQQQQPAKPKSNVPRSWADIANTPASKIAAAPAPPVQAPKPKQVQPPAQGPVATKKAVPPTGQVQKAPVKGSQEVGSFNQGSTKTLIQPRGPQIANYVDVNPSNARFFVIKSYSEDDIHKSIKYNIWASTDSGNRRLDSAYKESHMKGPIYLFFSVNASGQFCGMAQMLSQLDYNTKSNVWALDKWNGQFAVKWIFIKDIPNNFLRHIRLENNDNKPVTNSRDTQEILLEPGKEMLRIFATFKPKTSLLDDFSFYDQKQEELLKQKSETNTEASDEEQSNTNDTPVSSNTDKDSSEDSTGKGKRKGNKK